MSEENFEEDIDGMPAFGGSDNNKKNSNDEESLTNKPVFDNKKKYAQEVEDYILGNIIANPIELKDQINNLSDSDFYVDSNRLLFFSIKKSIDINENIEITSLSDIFSNEREIPYGEAYSILNHIYIFYKEKNESRNVTEIRKDFESNYKILKTYSSGRALDSIAANLLKGNRPKTPDSMSKLLQETSSVILDLNNQIIVKENKTIHAENAVDNLFKKIEAGIENNEENGSDIVGIPTGFPQFDEAINGLQDDILFILAGRPSMGKTAIALQIMLNMALKGTPILFFSIEMPHEKIVLRWISNLSGVKSSNILKGRLSDKEWIKVKEAANTVGRLNFYINDDNSMNMSQMKQYAQHWYNENILNKNVRGSIWVDYLQLINIDSNKKYGNRTEAVGDISKGLKDLSRWFAPTVALSQLNRSLEQRPNKRPINADLRDSGSIEQDADIIGFIYRDEVYNPETAEKNIAELIIGKQRDGGLGTLYLDFMKDIQRFKEREFKTL